MKKIILHCAPPHSYYYFENQLVNREQQALAILPVNRAVRLLRQRLLDKSESAALAAPHIYTFDQLLLTIYSILPNAGRVLSSGMLEVLIESILEENQAAFNYFKFSNRITAGLVKKIAATINELRRFGYNGSEFAEIKLEEKQKYPLKFSDFELLLQKLDAKLGKDLLDESFAKHKAASEMDEEHFKRLFPSAQEIYINGYGLFTPAMFAFVEKAANWLPVHIKLEYAANNESLFKHIEQSYLKFKAMGAEEVNEIEHSFFAGRLFQRKQVTSDKIDQKERIKIQAVQDRKSELEFIASEIRRLYFDEKIPLAKIGLTFANLESYVPLIRQTFSRYGIPFNLSTGFALKQSPLIRLYIQTLKLITSSFEWQKIKNLLSSSFILTDEINLSSIQSILIKLRIRNLRPGQIEFLKNSKIVSQLPEEERDAFNRSLEKLEQFLLPFYEFPQNAGINDFYDAYVSLLQKLNLLNWYKLPVAHLNERQKEYEFRAFNRFIKLLEQTMWILVRVQQNQIGLERFVQYLESALEQAVFNLTEWPDYGVQIMPRLEIEAVEPQVLILGGLVDGEFPRASSKDVFFNDTLREKMGLVATEDLLAQDRFIFYSLLDTSAQKIILTYPKYEEERALVPSTFVDDLCDVVQVEVAELKPEEKNLQTISEHWNQIGQAVGMNDFSVAEESMRILMSVEKDAEEKIEKLLAKIKWQTERNLPSPFTEYEGVLTGNKQILVELQKSYSNRTWSASRLEMYGFCPMQYFLNHILRVPQPESFEGDLTSLERGNLIHDILFTFYSTLKENKQTAQPLQHRALLFEIAQEAIAQLPFSGYFWELEKQKLFGAADKKGLLDTFLENEQEQIEANGFIPTYFEYDFGGQRHSKISLTGNSGKINLRGRIDRIDVNAENQAQIIDYKTGKSSASRNQLEVLEGISLQIPLYLLALQEERPELQVDAGSYYLVKDAKNCEQIPFLVDAPAFGMSKGNKKAFLPNRYVKDADGNQISFEELLNISLSKTVEHTLSLQNGVFRHSEFPDKAACQSYCSFKRICQKVPGKIKKMSGKQQEEEE